MSSLTLFNEDRKGNFLGCGSIASASVTLLYLMTSGGILRHVIGYSLEM